MQALNNIAKVHFPYRELFTIEDLNPHVENFKERWKTAVLIRKKNRKFRVIFEPKVRTKILLKCFKILFEGFYNPNQCVTAFVKGRNIVTNASKHIASKWIYNIDLKDFFNSISLRHVEIALSYPPFGLYSELAKLIANICCIHNATYGRNGKFKMGTFLPQGSPVSPILSNMVCRYMDKELKKMADIHGFRYSRYADDITFSGSTDISKNQAFLSEVHRILSNWGFNINASKTRIQRYTRRQIVTGLVVNRKINLRKRYIKEIRSIVHIWNKYGIDEAVECYSKRHGVVTNKCFKQLIRGKINYIKMIVGRSNSTIIQMIEEYNHCIRL